MAKNPFDNIWTSENPDPENLGAAPTPIRKSGTVVLLETMSDGRWWPMVVLWRAIEPRLVESAVRKPSSEWLSTLLSSAWRRNLIDRAQNPGWNGLRVWDRVRRCGGPIPPMSASERVAYCRYVYRINERGRAWLEKKKSPPRVDAAGLDAV